MNPALTLIAASVSAALGFGSAWQLQAGNITKINLDAANERIAIQRAARQVVERQTAQLATAQSNAAGRAVVLRRDGAGASSAAVGLRNAAEAAVRDSAASINACNSVATAQGIVLAESSGFIQEVARDADQCHIDLAMMRESWPKE